jgi:nucleotide-binding universal stress UspA family protein
MKTILIPVDFSETSSNALKYTLGLIKDLQVGKIILLKTFYKSFYEQILPSADFVQISAEDIQNERAAVELQLNALRDELQKDYMPTVDIQVATTEFPLLRSIVDLIAESRPDLLLLGSDGANASVESYIGQLILPIAKASSVPVLIIPKGVEYRKISNTLVPCDFTKISRLAVIQSLDSPLAWLHPKLVILNINASKNQAIEEKENLNSLKSLLEGYEYQVHTAEDRNPVHGILNFAEQNEIQMITALPGKYSFFYNLTHESTTEALASNAQHPVLILK